MKLVLLVCFVLAASGINANVAQKPGIQKLTKKMNKYVTECIKENSEEELDEINADVISARFSDDKDKDKETMEKVIRCFFHKASILEPDGKLNKDAAMIILLLIGVEKSDADELLQKCTSITGFDGIDTAYAIFNCLDGVAKTR